MAKSLIFQTDKSFSFSAIRVDRKKLYGWKDIAAFDEKGEECIKVDIDASGSFIIPKGGKTLGLLDKDGRWVDRKDLKAVNKDGSDAELLSSVFDHPILLEKIISVEEFLDYVIEGVYILKPDSGSEELIEKVKNTNGIFTFIFNYRQGYESSPSFLIESKGNLFILIGYHSSFEFIVLEQLSEINMEEDSETDASEDELDFSMM